MPWKNKEKEREYKQRYYLENKEEIDARNKVYADKNKHLQKVRGARYYAANKERVIERQKKFKADNPERCRRYDLKRRLRHQYGLSLQDYGDMLAAQQGLCVICNVKMRLNGSAMDSVSVDHDHETDEVRALLCRQCNTSLGQYEDNPALLRRAADYLDAHTGN